MGRIKSKLVKRTSHNLLKEDNKLSGVIETSVGFCILHLDSKTPIDLKKFDKQKETDCIKVK